jgi:large subunit ribosomal protein L1
MENKFLDAVKKLRKQESKKTFNQTVDLIINLKDFDVRKESFSLFITVPHQLKEKKIAGFLEKKSDVIFTIRKEDFPNYKTKKEIKDLTREYDFFVSSAKLMPSVATTFGRVLGPADKMPSPKLGLLPSEEKDVIEKIVKKINHTVRMRVKEPSIKIPVAKEAFTDEQIAENIESAYQDIMNNLPKKRDQVRNVKIKLTMGKPVAVEI